MPSTCQGGEAGMKVKFVYLVLTVFSIILIAGCTNKPVIENTSEIDSHENVKAAAWEFLNEKGWQDRAKDDFESAKVEKVNADSKYVLLDQTYDGKELLEVSFEDVDNAVTGTPLILVDSNANEVVGYMPSE